ncbi:MAG: penicillin-binding transpeptidase domain-containing protein [Peptococcaceae bacterium]|nr:penicillin-binding transpeptidase domain-containing protein [Peptococcaceae bacterium]
MSKKPMAQRQRSDKKNKDTYFRRDVVVYTALALLFCVIVGRLAYVQLINAAEIEAKASSRLALVAWDVGTPYRGSIVDAQGHSLAYSVEEREIFLDPDIVRDFLASPRNTQEWTLDKVAETLGQMLSLDQAYLQEELEKNSQYVLIAPNVEMTLAQQVLGLKIEGVGGRPTYRRTYPMQTLAAGTLGIVQRDGNGAEGLEYRYNDELLGKGSGVKSLQLTLDSTIQFLIEQEMTKLVNEYRPQRVCILAMDPMTGKILGSGSYPNFDPNAYGKTDPEQRKNLAVSMVYEPGSVFKIFTGSAAIEEAVFTQGELFHDPGYLNVGPMTITNWDSNMSSEGTSITFAQGMQASSNVVLAQVGQRLGKEKFFLYLDSFGFGRETGVDLPGEERGQLMEKGKVREIEMATMSFGQANLATPMQMLTAICAVANGGTIYKPYIVDTVFDEKNNVVRKNEPQVRRKILSEETCGIMNTILEGVVNQGTGSRAKIEGIRVAGKTGTAQKLNPETKEYYQDKYIVSFGAYAPAQDPKMALLVVVDTPQGDRVQGGQVAAPAAQHILEGALQSMGIPVAKETPGTINDVGVAGEGNVPPAVEVQPARPLVSGEACVPNLKGLTIRQAGQELARRGLGFSFKGSGLAAEQSPAPGTIVNVGDQVEVTFKPRE